MLSVQTRCLRESVCDFSTGDRPITDSSTGDRPIADSSIPLSRALSRSGLLFHSRDMYIVERARLMLFSQRFPEVLDFVRCSLLKLRGECVAFAYGPCHFVLVDLVFDP